MKTKEDIKQYILDNVHSINRFDDFKHEAEGGVLYTKMPWNRTVVLGFNIINHNILLTSAEKYSVDLSGYKLTFRTYNDLAHEYIYTTVLAYSSYERHQIIKPYTPPPVGSQSCPVPYSDIRFISNDEKHYWLDNRYYNSQMLMEKFLKEVYLTNYEHYIFPKSFMHYLVDITQDEHLRLHILTILTENFNLNVRTDILTFMFNLADGVDLDILKFQQHNLQLFLDIFKDSIHYNQYVTMIEYLYTNGILDINYSNIDSAPIIRATLTGNHRL